MLNNLNLNFLFDDIEKAIKNKDICLIEQQLKEKKLKQKQYADLFFIALKTDSYDIAKIIVKNMPTNTKASQYIDMLKEVLAYGTVNLAKWLMKEKGIYFHKNYKLLNAALVARSVLYSSLENYKHKIIDKIEIVHWLLSYQVTHRELKNQQFYNSLVVFNKPRFPIIDIIFENIKEEIWFKKIWQEVLIKCGMYNKLDLLLTIQSKNYFPIEEVVWNKILCGSIESYQDQLEVVNYILDKYPHFKQNIQNLLEQPVDNILWSREKFDALESLGLNFYNNEQVFYKIMKYKMLLEKVDNSTDYKLWDLLDIMRDKIAHKPAILEKIIYLPLEQEYLDFFMKCYNYFQLNKKIEDIPQQIVVAKTRKI